jgi:predicted extracellular nuclease
VINTNQYLEEAYESVLVTFENVTVTIAPDYNNEWYVSDGTGDALLNDTFYYPTTAPNLGNVYSSITGVISKDFYGFKVSPRFEADVILDTAVNQLPLISNLAISPTAVFPTDLVTITADVVDNDGTLATVNLKWGTASGLYTTTTPMTPAASTYSAEIPAQVEGSVIYYVVEATDNEAGFTSSEEASYTVNAELGEGVASDLFISEYCEPDGGNTKYIEIYNGTGIPVDLSAYSISKIGNGGAWGESTLELSGTLANNDVFVIANTSSDSSVIDQADLTEGSICTFNGDDAIGLAKNGVVIDAIGTEGADPGTGWNVAGETNATANHTLVRKATVASPTTDWTASSGTSADDSQWIVYDANTYGYVGSHTFTGAGSTPSVVATPAITPEAGEYNNEVEVTISCATPDAAIYYSLDGSAPTLVYSAPFTLTADATVKAYATKADLDDSAIAEVVYTIVTVIETVETPVITPATGTYYAEQSVTIETATADATIYYTLDGTDPTTASTLYTDAFTLTATTTVKALAVKAGMTNSALAEAIITIEELNITPGMIISEYIEGSSNNKAVEIYNGTGADVDLTPYTVQLGSNGGNWGNNYDMTGTLAAGEVIVITNSGSDATMLAVSDASSNVCYFNGDDAIGLLYNDVLVDVFGVYQTDPGASWDVAGVSGATVNHTLVRKNTVTVGNTDWAASAGTDATDSEWIVYPQDTFTYLGYHGIDVTATPEISPDAGSYTDEVEITITCPTDGATIYYTLDGSDPTASSTEYTAPFTITADATLKAIAMKADYEDSAIASADYTIIDSGIIPTGMIISEYIEGSSNNKALEIYNGTGADVDLTPYVVKLGSNGGDWGNTYDMAGTLVAGDVFVIVNDGANETYLALADTTSDVTYFNGDDAIGLFYNEVLIDVFGTYQTDPGTSWPVAGVEGATVNQTLVRKLTVTEGTSDWAISAGTDAADSQWVIYPIDTIDMLGSHSTPLAIVAAPVISPDGGDYQDAVTVTLTTSTADAGIYYTLDGSYPDDSSLFYTGSFTLTEDATVRAIAMKDGMVASSTTSAEFTVTQVSFEDGFTISETELNFTSDLGVESEIQSYTIYMQGSDLGMLEVTGDFQIQDTEGAWGSDFFFELEEEEFTVNVKFNATNAGTVYGEITHSIDGFDDIVIALTGTAIEVLPTSIYDIQYVADPSTDDASPYAGQEVLVQGIVTANNYGGKYFISSPEGGAWNGIYVYDTSNDPELGDLVSFSATVAEYYGWTELTSVNDFQIISSGNAIPAPVVITTAELASMEAYEGVLATIEDLTVTETPNSNDEWYVTDGSGDAQVDNGCFTLSPEVAIGDSFTSITGVVDYSYSNYSINPRSEADIVTTPLVTELATPVITSMTKVETGLRITWDPIENANYYYVYVSALPEGPFTLLTDETTEVEDEGSVVEVEYIYPIDGDMKFFQLRASTDPIPAAKK